MDEHKKKFFKDGILGALTIVGSTLLTVGAMAALERGNRKIRTRIAANPGGNASPERLAELRAEHSETLAGREEIHRSGG